jgi:hypothetical protein
MIFIIKGICWYSKSMMFSSGTWCHIVDVCHARLMFNTPYLFRIDQIFKFPKSSSK